MDVTAIMEKTVKNTERVHSRSASPPRTLTLFEAKSQLASPPYIPLSKTFLRIMEGLLYNRKRGSLTRKSHNLIARISTCE